MTLTYRGQQYAQQNAPAAGTSCYLSRQALWTAQGGGNQHHRVGTYRGARFEKDQGWIKFSTANGGVSVPALQTGAISRPTEQGDDRNGEGLTLPPHQTTHRLCRPWSYPMFSNNCAVTNIQ